MGTWAAPETKEDKKALKKAIKDIQKLKNELYHVFGDDDLFDHLDLAIDRIEFGIKTNWAPLDPNAPLINRFPVNNENL